MFENLKTALADISVVPVVTLDKTDDAKRLAALLVENGLPCAEVTFRTPNAASMMRVMRQEAPMLLLGAGTVLNETQLQQAIDAGVDFAVSPGFNPRVAHKAVQQGLPFLPGVNNPTALEQAMSEGFSFVKFFPAELSGGLKMLQTLSSVYSVSFMPTGGLTLDKVQHYLQERSVVSCGGTWIAAQQLIEAGEWTQIAENISNAAALSKSALNKTV